MAKVSVIIPTYNCAKFICEAIDSVLTQTYRDFEIIVIDDGSNDNTADLLKKYGNNIIRYIYQKNEGLSAARNRGICESTGEYIAFLDSDDCWLPQKLAIQLNAAEEDRTIGLVACYMQTIDENSILLPNIKPQKIAGENFDDAFRYGSPAPSTFVVQKKCILDIGLFDRCLCMFEDLDFYLRISQKFKIRVLSDILGKYRISSQNMTKNAYQVYQNRIVFNKKWLELAPTREIRQITITRIKKYANLLWRYYIKKINLFLGFYYLNIFISYHFYPYSKPVIKPKNICFYELSPGFGGSGNALFNLINHVNEKKFEPLLVIFNEGPQTEKIRKLGIKVIKFKAKKTEPEDDSTILSYFRFGFNLLLDVIFVSSRLIFLIKGLKIDLVHINNNIRSGIPAIIAAKISGVPCVCHIRQTRELVACEKFFVKWIDKIILINQKAIDIYSVDIPREKLAIVHDGLNLEEYIQTKPWKIRKELNLDNKSCVGIIGRLVEGKGQDNFIRAARIVINQYPEVKFLIVGSDRSKEKYVERELKNLVNSLDLTTNIIFTGWRDDIPEIISALDILVQASSSPEGFGLTCIEAMALSKPVVATNIPGPSDIVVDGETGFLIPPKNPEALANAILKLLNNQEVALRMGGFGKKRVEELFDIKKNILAIENTFSQLLQKKNEF